MRSLKVGKTTGNKPALIALLVERFGNINAEQFAEIERAVARGVAVATLPPAPAPNAAPLVLELTAPAAAPTPALPMPAPPMPLALTRPRRGQH